MRVMIRGEIFESVSAAMAAYGVSRRQLERHLDAGTVDQLEKRPAPNPPRKQHPASVPVAHNGVVYPSQASLARTIGLPYKCNKIAKRASEGTLDRLGKGRADNARKAPIVIAGRSFASIAELARFIGWPYNITYQCHFPSRRGMHARLTEAVRAKADQKS